MSHQTPDNASGPRRTRDRRAAAAGGRRPDLTVVLAVLLPVLLLLAAVLMRPQAASTVAAKPTTTALTRGQVVCPGPLRGRPGTDTTVGVGTAAAGASGEVTVTRSSSQLPAGRLSVTTDRVSDLTPTSDAVVVTGTRALAPGLLAGLASVRPVTALDCRPPQADQWFTGLGAGPTHRSVLELVNPDPGAAIADVEVLSEDGVLEVPDLRGIAVPGRSTERIDLGELIPREGVLALHARVVRGQVAMAVSDRGERVTGGTTTEDWLPAQSSPARSNLLLGVQPGGGRHTLTLANDTDDETRATIRLVSDQATFAPDKAPTVTVAPHSVASVWLDDVLQASTARGVVGVRVDSSEPVAASLRSVVAGDLSLSVPGDAFERETRAVLPPRDKQVVLGDAGRAGAALVVGYSAAGRQVASKRVRITPEQAVTIDLPASAELVVVTPSGTSLRGVVLVKAPSGSAVVPLRELLRSGRVPTVDQLRLTR